MNESTFVSHVPCPFCSSLNNRFAHTDDETVAIMCADCSGMGPSVDVQAFERESLADAEALRLWDSRATT